MRSSKRSHDICLGLLLFFLFFSYPCRAFVRVLSTCTTVATVSSQCAVNLPSVVALYWFPRREKHSKQTAIDTRKHIPCNPPYIHFHPRCTLCSFSARYRYIIIELVLINSEIILHNVQHKIRPQSNFHIKPTFPGRLYWSSYWFSLCFRSLYFLK